VEPLGLKYLKDLKHLKRVKLSFNYGVTDKGLEYFRGLTQLEDLHLGYTRVTSRGVQALRKKLPKAKIAGP
jgi:hypothetical protein